MVFRSHVYVQRAKLENQRIIVAKLSAEPQQF